MLLREIISRLLKHHCSPSFWVARNGAATLACAPSDKGYVISYLQYSCGLSSKNAIRASKQLHFDCPDKPNAVLDFLGKQGFTQSQITKIVDSFPRVLLANPDSCLLPKIEFLNRSTGISEREIIEVVCKNPALLKTSLKRRVAPVYNYVKGIIGGGRTDNLLRKGSWIFLVDLEGRIKPNVDYLREVGVPERVIEFAIPTHIRIFQMDHVEFKRVVEEVKQMGFDPLKSTFVSAANARMGKVFLALWDQSIEVYSMWGWTEEDIRMAYTTHPNCMRLSKKNISTTLDYLVNTLGLDSRMIARCPQALFYSLEGRIVPRCSVACILSLEGLIKKDWKLMSVLAPSEDKFLDRFVTSYIDGKEICLCGINANFYNKWWSDRKMSSLENILT